MSGWRDLDARCPKMFGNVNLGKSGRNPNNEIYTSRSYDDSSSCHGA